MYREAGGEEEEKEVGNYTLFPGLLLPVTVVSGSWMMGWDGGKQCLPRLSVSEIWRGVIGRCVGSGESGPNALCVSIRFH